MRGNLIVSWDNGTSVLFPTTNGFNAGVDRFTVDRGTITIGDVQRFPLYVKAGRDVLSFGTSTGVHRADVLSFENPLTIEVFETQAEFCWVWLRVPNSVAGPAAPGLYRSTCPADGSQSAWSASSPACLDISHQSSGQRSPLLPRRLRNRRRSTASSMSTMPIRSRA